MGVAVGSGVVDGVELEEDGVDGALLLPGSDIAGASNAESSPGT